MLYSEACFILHYIHANAQRLSDCLYLNALCCKPGNIYNNILLSKPFSLLSFQVFSFSLLQFSQSVHLDQMVILQSCHLLQDHVMYMLVCG
jgi:hypothetical protein